MGWKRAAVLALSLVLAAACSSGGGEESITGVGSGGDNNSGNPNAPPTANAGADQTVGELSVVDLSGSGSDANGDTLSYSWAQISGPSVTLSNANAAQASFTAPDVTGGASEILTFELTVSDGSASTSDSVAITVQESADFVDVTGAVQYEFVPPRNTCQGLDFDNTEVRPIRAATVQLVDAATGAVLHSTTSSESGDYTFSSVVADTRVRLRVRAELKRFGVPSWDVEVRDNVDTRDTPIPLASRPLYVLEGSDFDTGSVDNSRPPLIAATGWTDSSYTETRSAAPFAVLDAVYSAMRFILTADPGASFVPLDVFWSVNNTRDKTGTTDIDSGALGGSFYSSLIDSLFLVGDANGDTDEFDDHVIVHEWGHYFEDNFSRSDSIGGAHSIGDRLDPRLAFGEGWATALSGMALGNPIYCDTNTPGSSAGFAIGTEDGSWDGRGWYDEISIVRFIYDMWDDADDGDDADTVAVGFAPIYEVMTGPQRLSEAFTSIFSFATELRARLNPADQLGLDAQLAREDMTAENLDSWGGNELAIDTAADPVAASRPNVFPIYTDLAADGSPTRICSSKQFDTSATGNKLSEYRLLRVDIENRSRYRITANTIDPPSTPPPSYNCDTAPELDPNDPNIHLHSDPDIEIFRMGAPALAFGQGTSCEPNSEVATTATLDPGTYVLDLREFRFADPEASPDFPRPGDEEICFAVTMQALN